MLPMLVNRILISFLLFCSFFSMRAEEATGISGHAPDLIGHIVYVYGYNDFISESKVLLDSANVADDGEFLLNFNNKIISVANITLV